VASKTKDIGISLQGIERIGEASSLEALLTVVHEEIVSEFNPSRTLLVLRNENLQFIADPFEWYAEHLAPVSANVFLKLIRKTDDREWSPEREFDAIEPVWSLGHRKLLFSRLIIPKVGSLSVFIFDAQFGDSEKLETFLKISYSIFSKRALASADSSPYQGDSGRYIRLVEHSDAILFNTAFDHSVKFISRRALDFFGMAPEEFTSGKLIRWLDLVLPEDSQRLKSILARQGNKPDTIDEEVRVINRITGRVRWVLIRLVPVISAQGDLEGWDGFGIDISARKDAQEALDQQSKKIRALYTVSSAIRGYLEPANISIRGLAALCDATGAHAGICFLYSSKSEIGTEAWESLTPRQPRELQQIARYGFKPGVSDKESILGSIAAFAAYVANSGQSLVVPDLCSDPRSDVSLATQDELRSAIFVPIAVEEEVLGAVGLFSQRPSSFDGSTVMLVGAAANQVGLAARQANLFGLYQRQTKNLSALYRMSHELSRHLELDALFQNAFSIIRDELGLKRLWLGLLDESGTRLEGRAVYGPGWRRRLIDVVVNVTSSDHALGRVVKTRKPVVIERSEDLLTEFGVKRLFNQMSIHAVAVVPILASGEIIGVLAVQPGVNEPEFKPEQLHLLLSLASEIGVNIQTIRLAARTREGEKMRTSSVLAAGIAHNFNNSLQAILGQASLLEMQKASPERVEKAAKAITEAANKSAVLVRQLLSFTQLEEPKKEILDVRDFLTLNRDVFAKILTQKNALEIDISNELRSVYLDASQLTRVFAALLQNSQEAMPNGGKVFITADPVEIIDERSLSEVPPGRYVRIRVRDTGVGMSEEVRKRCFEPFFTTKNLDESSGIGLTGAGLGLAAAYTLIKRNSGRILIESQMSSGTTVTLYLPEATKAQLDRYEQVHFERQLKVERLRSGGNKSDKEKGVPVPQKSELPEKPTTPKRPEIGVPQGNA
jgi:PAS domain S-box-containing protein